jgi:hypothetical protein
MRQAPAAPVRAAQPVQARATSTIIWLKVGGALAAFGGFVGCGASLGHPGTAVVGAVICVLGFIAFVVGRFMQ